MNVLSRLYGSAQGAILKVTAKGVERELPQTEIYKMLWWHYLNNGLYDQLRKAGYYTNDAKLKAIRNPSKRAVEFYVDTVWPGDLDKALPVATDNARLLDAINQLWVWSNWGQKKQIAVRWGAIMGDCYLKVAQPGQKERVYIDLVDPVLVTDRSVDERGYVTYCRIDVPVEERGGDKVKARTYTEVWDREKVRTWTHDKDRQTAVIGLGEPDEEIPLSAWGIDFVPIVHVKHVDIGDKYGVGAFQLSLDKIREVDTLATALHRVLFRHNLPVWALEANAVDANGRPIVPPRFADTTGETVELSGETLVKLPGMAKLVPLVPNLDYQSHLAVVAAQIDELSEDLPELNYYRLRDLPEMSGRALRLMLAPAVNKAEEVRGNYEEGLIRAHKMALTIGKALGVWARDPGNYEAGDFDHSFITRPIIPLTRSEIAEIVKSEVDAGIPLITALRRSGWTEDELAQMEEDKAAEAEAQQATLARALLDAQDSLNAGQQSNGLDQ